MDSLDEKSLQALSKTSKQCRIRFGTLFFRQMVFRGHTPALIYRLKTLTYPGKSILPHPLKHVRHASFIFSSPPRPQERDQGLCRQTLNSPKDREATLLADLFGHALAIMPLTSMCIDVEDSHYDQVSKLAHQFIFRRGLDGDRSFVRDQTLKHIRIIIPHLSQGGAYHASTQLCDNIRQSTAPGTLVSLRVNTDIDQSIVAGSGKDTFPNLKRLYAVLDHSTRVWGVIVTDALEILVENGYERLEWLVLDHRQVLRPDNELSIQEGVMIRGVDINDPPDLMVQIVNRHFTTLTHLAITIHKGTLAYLKDLVIRMSKMHGTSKYFEGSWEAFRGYATFASYKNGQDFIELSEWRTGEI
ncbi:uncharacterized protein FFB20_05315 [Fusarium fujikuroi]|uniref:Uncharacterized protein n=1 Tax=Fusarium fujikuroi TaxID=5127 RepID=A0A9Q9U516_FUSFU|nr:uncharacterized protein FFB20_05315 [Fusarium fujikuroi]VTT55728.1 unnamed protein product [Fusarium fujikuroi]VTT58663.1 unnamed protein product [Fusarium fujikuroi]